MQSIGVLLQERRPKAAYATFSHKGRRKKEAPASHPRGHAAATASVSQLTIKSVPPDGAAIGNRPWPAYGRIALMRGRRRQHDAVCAHDAGKDDENAEQAGFHRQPRSLSKRAIAARNSGIPAPVRDEVTRTSGKAAGCFVSAALTSATRCSSSAGFT